MQPSHLDSGYEAPKTDQADIVDDYRCRECCAKAIERLAEAALALTAQAIASVQLCGGRCYPPCDPRENGSRE